MVLVYFETDNGYAEIVASFLHEELYMACMKPLEEECEKGHFSMVTESVCECDVQLDLNESHECNDSLKTVINPSMPVYSVSTSTGHGAFFNFKDINRVMNILNARPGYYSIYKCDNFVKFKRVSNRELLALFESHKMVKKFD